MSKFLRALFTSGNRSLILALAASPRQTQEAASLFDDVTSLSDSLGKAVRAMDEGR